MKNLDRINSSLNINKRDNKKMFIIIGIVLAVVMIVTITVFAILFVATDIFKSDKELFLERIGQVVNSENGLLKTDLTEYINKKQTTPYEDNGTFATNITVSDPEEQGMYEKTNEFNIDFSGQVDKSNLKSSQELNLNYSEEVSLPIRYKKIGTLMGIQTDELAEEYISIDTANIKNITGEEQIDLEILENIPNVIQLTTGERQQLKQTYTKLLDEQLTNDKFSEVIGPVEGYRLTLKGEDIKNILVEILETAKNDQVFLDKLSQMQTSEETITTDFIDNIITNLNSMFTNDETLDITVYSENKIVNRITVETNKNFSVEITKQDSSEGVQYNVSYKTPKLSVTVNASYNGLNSESVNENYSIRYGTNTEGEEAYYTHTITNNVNFIENSEIEDFNEDEVLVVTDYPQEQISNFLLELRDKIEKISNKYLKDAEISEEENPILHLFPGINIFSILEEQASKNIEATQVTEQSEETEEPQEQQEQQEQEQEQGQPEENQMSALEIAQNKINTVLNEIIKRLSENPELPIEEVYNILVDSGLTENSDSGSYSTTNYNPQPEGDTGTVLAIRWISADGESQTTGEITYDPNSESKYQLKQAE